MSYFRFVSVEIVLKVLHEFLPTKHFLSHVFFTWVFIASEFAGMLCFFSPKKWHHAKDISGFKVFSFCAVCTKYFLIWSNHLKILGRFFLFGTRKSRSRGYFIKTDFISEKMARDEGHGVYFLFYKQWLMRKPDCCIILLVNQGKATTVLVLLPKRKCSDYAFSTIDDYSLWSMTSCVRPLWLDGVMSADYEVDTLPLLFAHAQRTADVVLWNTHNNGLFPSNFFCLAAFAVFRILFILEFVVIVADLSHSGTSFFAPKACWFLTQESIAWLKHQGI